ncbi:MULTISPECIES: PP2C family protein-serine/threonine phosphatase [unclassified Microbacterium]|uniref:PP2C family protein-serine/threonine phosphatase n=1 Tax=unclassified Microbacterium TaxID=2609290 RepID=UPI003864CA7E
MRVRAGAASDVGAYRDVNQDAAFAAAWGAAVADGVGGGPSGDLASASLIHRLITAPGPVDSAEVLISRLRGANWDLGAHVRRDPALSGMATTLTGVWLTTGGDLLLAHTGDSRGYLLRDGILSRQTRDDSFVQELVDRGLVPPEDASTHPRRNIITASLGGHENDVVRVETRDARVGDRWLLCSDGLTDYVPEDAVAEILRGMSDPQAAAARLVEFGLGAASRDNITAVVCDVTADTVPPGAVPLLTGSAASRFPEVIEAGWATA